MSCTACLGINTITEENQKLRSQPKTEDNLSFMNGMRKHTRKSKPEPAAIAGYRNTANHVLRFQEKCSKIADQQLWQNLNPILHRNQATCIREHSLRTKSNFLRERMTTRASPIFGGNFGHLQQFVTRICRSSKNVTQLQLRLGHYRANGGGVRQHNKNGLKSRRSPSARCRYQGPYYASFFTITTEGSDYLDLRNSERFLKAKVSRKNFLGLTHFKQRCIFSVITLHDHVL